ncbi:MAG: hypothetical protein KBH14_09375 [Vicinamibacteria bacterium]|jgi:hypothetical protein|nr:hypothetical protein [Vicinamibacteria bacterium]MBP9946594.1 hypothetical protein [Vicinamibacteria bacterium]
MKTNPSPTLRHVAALLLPLAFVGCGGECYVGVRGTEASVTVKATLPNDTCEAVIKNPTAYFGDIAEDGKKELYAMSEPPLQPVICEYNVQGKHFMVRDDGMFKVVGNLLCSGLAKRADK